MATAGNPHPQEHNPLAAYHAAERNVLAALAEMRVIALTLSRQANSTHRTGPQGECFVVQLSEARLTEPTSCTPAEATLLIESRSWDLILDEIHRECRVQTDNEISVQSLHGLPLTLRGWLWLALTHVGGAVLHGKIATLFALPSKGREDRIHQMRARVGKALGSDLSRRIFGQGINHAYPIHREGWSFLWIRRSADPHESALLPEELRARVRDWPF